LGEVLPQAPAWVVLVTALAAVAGFASHVRFVRADAGSGWARRYFDPDLPKEVRNLPFAQLPAAVAAVLWAVTLACAWIPAQGVLDPLVPFVLLGSVVPAGTAVKRLYRPPAGAKPAWLREEEARRDGG
jgi:hypothetical protein